MQANSEARCNGHAVRESFAEPVAELDVVPEFLTKPELGLLTEVGFLAAFSGQFDAAETIFKALMRCVPDRLEPAIGLAVTWINADRLPQALALLDKTQSGDAYATSLVQLWRGVALKFSGYQQQSDQALELARATGELGAPLADAILSVRQ